jgi:hypothetical protein
MGTIARGFVLGQTETLPDKIMHDGQPGFDCSERMAFSVYIGRIKNH